MEIETRNLGRLRIEDNQLVNLTRPMPGFDGCVRFAVLDSGLAGSLRWLQSVDRPEVCFLIGDPADLFPDYRPRIARSVLADIEVGEEEVPEVAVVLTVPENPAGATANLAAPLVFNRGRGLGRQVILDGAGYGTRTPLFASRPR